MCARYLDTVDRYCSPDLIVVAVGDNADMVDSRQVSKEEAESLFSHHDPPIPYYEVSTRTGEGVDHLFRSSVRLWLARNARKRTLKYLSFIVIIVMFALLLFFAVMYFASY